MSASVSIKRFLRLSSAGLFLMGALRGTLRAVPVCVAGLFVLAGLDRWVELAPLGRQALWTVFALGGLAAFISGFVPFRLFSLFERSRNLSLRAPSLRQDDLRIASEFSSHPAPAELQAEFQARMAAILRTCSPFWCFPSWAWKKPALLAGVLLLMVGSVRAFFPLLLPMESRTLFPFWSFELEKKIKIEPGDAQVPIGKDAQIRLTVLEEERGKPLLMVKTGEQWLEIDAETESGREFSYKMKAVVSPLLYRVGWRGEWSRKFTLTPVQPISIASFAVRLTPPDYTGKAVLEQSTPEISGLVGSRVEMTIQANNDLKYAVLIFSDNREVPAENVSGKKALFRFDLSADGTYGFALTPKDGVAVRGEILYPIHVVSDNAPTITLLSPDQDVVIGEKEKLPVTYDARDDYGLGEIILMWEVASGNKKTQRIAAFDGVVENSLATFKWDLALHKFVSGEVARFRVGVVDKNKVTGPGEGWSEWRVLELRSFEKEHALIEKALEAWRDKAVETLAQLTTLEKKVEKESPDMAALAKEFNAPQKNLERLDEEMKQILNKMEQDPLADYGVWLEHKAMQENLAMMNQTTAKDAQSAFQTQNKAAAAENLDAMGKELERMTALSEDLSKSQKARDVTQAGENLEELGEDLMSQIQNSKADAESMNKINQLLAEAHKNLMEMAQALQQMPEELPDDFVNQEALQDLDLAKSQDILSEIAEAMKQGDMARAMDLAKKFLAAAKAMRKQVSKAHESFMKSNSAEDLAKKIDEQQKALEEVTRQQRLLLSETQALASKQMDALMIEQEELLAHLAERQEKINVEARKAPLLAGQLPTMAQVAEEFKAKRVDKSPEWLAAIVVQTQLVRSELERSSATATMEIVRKVHSEEADILSILKDPPPPKQGTSAFEQRAYVDLQRRQQEARQKTQELRQALQNLSRKTASLGGPLMQALGRASTEMAGAAGELGGQNGVAAQRSEERALDNLLQGQAALDQAQSNMAAMAAEQGGEMAGGDMPGGGSGGGPRVILRSGGASGRGQQTGKVKLPSADDYRAPKAFREDLMESLKENYPKVYEDIIHKYYKRLAQ